MHLREVRGLFSDLSERDPIFHYFRGRHALLLLQDRIRAGGASVRELRTTPDARLLETETAREALASAGGGFLRREHLENVWRRHLSYRITLTRWGNSNERNGQQTSRLGYNLVVQLNLPRSHESVYQTTIRPKSADPFSYLDHPVSREERTLAWARIDVSATRKEALVEELQSDWLRLVSQSTRWIREYVRSGKDRHRIENRFGEVRRDLGRFERYERYLAPHRILWSEALLSASLQILAELGVERVWLHSPESGVRYKNIEGKAPPRSLYTDLPKRFAFVKGMRAPRFIDDARKAQRLETGALMWARALGAQTH